MSSSARPPHVDHGTEFHEGLSAPPPELRALPAPRPSHEEISHLANLLWTARSREPGRELDDWFEAERQLRGIERFDG